jgi:ATP-dependent Lon protease
MFFHLIKILSVQILLSFFNKGKVMDISTINNILDNKDDVALEQFNLKLLDFSIYHEILKQRFSLLPDSHYMLTEFKFLKKFIKKMLVQVGKNNKELEIIHHDLLVTWLKEKQSEENYTLFIGQEVVEFLSKIISNKKLNEYDEHTQSSVLKACILKYENLKNLKSLMNNGLKIINIEGLNPYFYILKHSTSVNLIIQFLEVNALPLPKKYWSYVFNGINNNNINEERDYLLSLSDKEFIVDNKNKECVWHKIIKSKKYSMLKYIPVEFYKPYQLNEKSIVDFIIEHKNYSILDELKEDIFKLVEKEDELYKIWNICLTEQSSSQNLIMNHFHVFCEVISELENEKLDSISILKEQVKLLNLDSDINKDKQIFLKHFKSYLEQLNEEGLMSFFTAFDSHLKTLLTKELVVEESNTVQTDVVSQSQTQEDPEKEKESDEIWLNLFTDKNYEKFKKDYSQSNNEIVTKFIKSLDKKLSVNQKKSLAKASVLLEKLDELYETFPHFESVIKHMENLMILQEKGDKSFYIPPLLLGGGPGIGKTFFCNTLSELVNTRFEVINMESVTANFVLTGGNAQWNSADTGKIFKTLFHEDNNMINPIILLDELEKGGGDSRYGVHNALLPLLERYTAKKFKDECIPLEIDASYIVWFATANDLDKISAPIKSRFDIFSVPNPTPNQRKALIKGIYKKVREGNSWGHYFDENLPEESLDMLANLMAPGAARDLRKSITLACSKAVKAESTIILPMHIEQYSLGEVMPWDVIL